MKLITVLLVVLIVGFCCIAQAFPNDALTKKAVNREIDHVGDIVRNGMIYKENKADCPLVIIFSRVFLNMWCSGMTAYGIGYKDGSMEKQFTKAFPKTDGIVIEGEFAGYQANKNYNLIAPGIKMLKNRKDRLSALAQIQRMRTDMDVLVEDAGYRVKVVKEYITIGPFITISKGLSSDKWPLRELLVKQLGELPEEWAKDQNRNGLLVQAMQDKSHYVRAAANRVCMKVKDDSFGEPLTKLLSDKDSEVRYTAAIALVRQGYTPALPKLKAMSTKDPANTVRFFAAMADDYISRGEVPKWYDNQ